MAGVDPNAGMSAPEKSVPSIGGPARIAGGGHTEGTAPSYSENLGTGPDGNGYPAGTAMKDNTPSDTVN